MKLKDFKKKMVKKVFTATEAHILGFTESPAIINLQLHQWKKSGDLIGLKRGLYMFSDYRPQKAAIAKELYSPCYFSLEYVLSLYGIIPEAVFAYTLVTPKTTRHFKTSEGVFSYRKIKREAFVGFDQETLMAEKEKALVDYFYMNSAKLQPNDVFWEESRLEAKATEINFKRVFMYAKLFSSKKLNILLTSFYNYAKSH